MPCIDVETTDYRSAVCAYYKYYNTYVCMHIYLHLHIERHPTVHGRRNGWWPLVSNTQRGGRGCGITHCCCFLGVICRCQCCSCYFLLTASLIAFLAFKPSSKCRSRLARQQQLQLPPNPALLMFRFTSRTTSTFAIPYINRWQMLVLVVL